MSCISSNFSSFFLNSLNDPSEFSKYLSNGELRFSSAFEDFPVYGQSNVQQQQHHINGGVLVNANGEIISSSGEEGNSNIENTQPIATSVQHYGSYQAHQQQQMTPQHHGHLQHQQQQTRWALPHQQASHQQNLPQNSAGSASSATVSGVATSGNQHFDGSFEFMKYLRHSNDNFNDSSHDGNGQHSQTQTSQATAVGTKPEASLNNGLMDLDNAHKRATARKTPLLSSANSNHHNPTASNSSHPTPMDVYDHDSKPNIYDLHHMNSMHSSNSNESSMELSSINYPNSHLNASNSNTSSEGGNTQNHSDFSMLSGVENSQNLSTANTGSTAAAAAAASPAAPKPLSSFTIKENFEAHPSHKVEEGIFQHMNKLPSKKKDNLKQLGVRFTGQMTLNDKSIIVENFIKFCQEYDIQDHRPFLSLNQSGLNKPDQIKFARYLGQGLPTFTLFCIYSNFKNLFCTKRTEIYTKDGYNLPYILDKIKRFLANTTAGNNNNNASNSSPSTTTSKDNFSSSNTNSTNSNTTSNTTTAVNANNSNTNNHNNAANAVPVAMQNGNSNGSSSSCSGNTGNDNGKNSNGSTGSSTINNEIINTPTKQIHNVPSPATPQIQHQQTQQQIPIQTQNTPLPAHPPPPPTHIMANHTATPQTHLHPHHHHQQLQHHPQQQHHHHVQMPMSPMVVVTSAASVTAPATLMASPLPPTVSVAATVTQSTTNHNQHPLHMQPNNHLPLHPHHPHHQHVHPVAQPLIQHHTTAVVYQQQQQQQQIQQHHHQPQLQNHHPLHNLAAQNPPL